MWGRLTLLACLALATPVSAQAPRTAPVERPPLAPTRDASVLYRLTSTAGPPQEVRVTTRAGGSPIRIDMQDRSYVLVDLAAQRMSMVVMDEQAVMEMPFQGPPPQFSLNDRMRFVRRGADTVAATRCTVWDVALDRQRGVVCVTEDGIMLRTQGQDERGRRTLIEAVSVSLAPATPDEFSVPAEYERLAAPPAGPAP